MMSYSEQLLAALEEYRTADREAKRASEWAEEAKRQWEQAERAAGKYNERRRCLGAQLLKKVAETPYSSGE